MHQVRIYSGHPDHGGKLKKVIRQEDLTFIDDPSPEKTKANNRYTGSTKNKPRKATCEICKRVVKIYIATKTTCKKRSCEMMARAKRIEGRAKIRGNRI